MVPVLFGPIKPTWTPALLTGFDSSVLVALSRTQNKLWQDVGKTTNATADGHPVRIATCPLSGVDYSTASDSTRYTLRVSGNIAWLEPDGVDDVMTSARSKSQPFTLFASGRVATAGSTHTLFDGGATNQAYGAKAGAAQSAPFDIFNGGAGFSSSNNVDTANTVRMGAYFSGASSRIYLNGTRTNGTSGTAALTGVTVGCRRGFPTLVSQRIYGFVVAGDITDAEAARLDTYLASLGA